MWQHLVGAMNDAAKIALRHKTGSAGRLLDHSQPKPLRDHRRDNIRAVHQMNSQLRKKRAESALPDRPLFKLREFENVPSRLHERPSRLGIYNRMMPSASPPMTPTGSQTRSASTPATGGSRKSNQMSPSPADGYPSSRCSTSPQYRGRLAWSSPRYPSMSNLDVDEGDEMDLGFDKFEHVAKKLESRQAQQEHGQFCNNTSKLDADEGDELDLDFDV